MIRPKGVQFGHPAPTHQLPKNLLGYGAGSGPGVLRVERQYDDALGTGRLQLLEALANRRVAITHGQYRDHVIAKQLPQPLIDLLGQPG